jgi:hypothetical protein
MRADAGRPAAPPLTVWLAAAALAIAAVLALLALPYSPEQAVAGLLSSRTREVLAAPKSGVRVIGMGSSLLQAATPASAAGALDWARITKSNLGLGELAPSVALVEAAPPDVLVIEKNLLITPPDGDAMNKLRINAVYGFKKLLSNADARFDPLLPIRAEQTGDAPCGDRRQRMSEKQRAQHDRSLRQAYGQDPAPVLAAALLRLAGRGVQVMIVDIQRSAEIEQALAQDKQRWFARLRQMLPPGPHLSYHTGPSYSQESLYCDAMHLNAAGSRLFQAWWWNELKQEQKAMR